MSENKDVDPTKQTINPLAAEEQGGATGSRRSPKNVFAPSPVSLTSVDLQTSHDEQEEEVLFEADPNVDLRPPSPESNPAPMVISLPTGPDAPITITEGSESKRHNQDAAAGVPEKTAQDLINPEPVLPSMPSSSNPEPLLPLLPTAIFPNDKPSEEQGGPDDACGGISPSAKQAIDQKESMAASSSESPVENTNGGAEPEPEKSKTSEEEEVAPVKVADVEGFGVYDLSTSQHEDATAAQGDVPEEAADAVGVTQRVTDAASSLSASAQSAAGSLAGLAGGLAATLAKQVSNVSDKPVETPAPENDDEAERKGIEKILAETSEEVESPRPNEPEHDETDNKPIDGLPLDTPHQSDIEPTPAPVNDLIKEESNTSQPGLVVSMPEDPPEQETEIIAEGEDLSPKKKSWKEFIKEEEEKKQQQEQVNTDAPAESSNPTQPKDGEAEQPPPQPKGALARMFSAFNKEEDTTNQEDDLMTDCIVGEEGQKVPVFPLPQGPVDGEEIWNPWHEAEQKEIQNSKTMYDKFSSSIRDLKGQASKTMTTTLHQLGIRQNLDVLEPDMSRKKLPKPKYVRDDEDADADGAAAGDEEEDDKRSLSSLGSNCMADAVLPPGPSPEELDQAVDDWLMGAVVIDNVVDIPEQRTPQATIEKILLWMLSPSIDGIQRLGLPSANARAVDILGENGNNVVNAVEFVVSGSETTSGGLVIDFLLERIPLVGFPSVLLKSLWTQLRSAAIIAALYSHDLHKQRTQHEILWCLVPQNMDDQNNAKKPGSHETMLRDTARKVSKALIKGVLHRATGLSMAADLCELASNLYGISHDKDDGFMHVVNTPAARARDYFRPYVGLSLGFWIPVLLSAWISPFVFNSIMNAPRYIERNIPLAVRATWPAIVLALIAGLVYFRNDLPYDMYERGREMLANPSPTTTKIVASIVFMVHAFLPFISAFNATRLICRSSRSASGLFDIDWISSAALGIYNLSALIHRQIISEFSHLPPAYANAFMRVRTFSQRAIVVICIWFYGITMMDRLLLKATGGKFCFGVDELNSYLLDDTAMIWGRGGYSIPFLLSVCSSWAQQRLLDLLRRREALLRLVGAERVLAASLVLVMKGVTVAYTEGPTKALEFLEKASPPPVICFLVMMLRLLALPIGICSVTTYVFMREGYIPQPSDAPLACCIFYFIFGLGCGVWVTHMWWKWLPDFSSDHRMLMLIPGEFSEQGKRRLTEWMSTAQRKAVQYVALGLFERIFRRFVQKEVQSTL